MTSTPGPTAPADRSEYRVGVTSSRTWTDRQRVWDDLDAVLLYTTTMGRRLVVVHGKARRGGDLHAQQWYWRARTRFRDPNAAVRVEPVPADWRHRGAGLQRNTVMVARGADRWLVYGMPCDNPGCGKYPRPHVTHGTLDCAVKAMNAGIPLARRLHPDLQGRLWPGETTALFTE